VDVQADLSAFTLGSMLRLVPALRELSANCSSVEQFAQRVSEFLFGAFVDDRRVRQTALVRVYGTAALEDLPQADQDFVARSAVALPAATTCLVLLGTAGAQAAWHDRTASEGHRVIPLPDAAQVARLPMIAALLTQLGIDIEALVSARADIVLPTQEDAYRVFYVPQALGSPVIPAQDFVTEHGVASALGFGGALPGGEMYAVVLFTTVPVPLTAASLFGTVALSTSLAAVDMMDLPLLDGQAVRRLGGGRGVGVPVRERERVRYALTQALLRTHEQVALAEADRAAAALEQARYDAARAASIAAVALQLGSVRSVADVTELLVRDGLPILGASGASLALTDRSGGTARLYVSSSFEAPVRQKYVSLPLDDAVPTTLTARTGEPVQVTDRVDGTARFPALAKMYRDTGVEAIASLPLQVGERLLGCVTFTWATPMLYTPAATELMGALAAQAAQAVDRVRLLDAERDQSATLQRSFLTRPARPTDVEIEVRYQPAAKHAQIGGDWYDAFVGPDGATVIAVGDVVGHDMLAAAVMGQVRNLLRGIVFSRPGSPADILRHLETAMAGLELETSATLFLARLEPADADASGHRRLEWCNAGHPPPLLVHGPTGAVEVLDPDPDLMIGVEPGVDRTVHRRVVAPGSLLLLYTDGLVERRGEDLQDGIGRLALALAQHHDAPLRGLADEVLALSNNPLEDDAALLALRLPADGVLGTAPHP
jgi:serine phosphatase RsbU (regulator of sigma subunit)